MDEVTCEKCKSEVPRWAAHACHKADYHGHFRVVDVYICVQCQLDQLLTAMAKDQGVDVRFADR